MVCGLARVMVSVTVVSGFCHCTLGHGVISAELQAHLPWPAGTKPLPVALGRCSVVQGPASPAGTAVAEHALGVGLSTAVSSDQLSA